MHPDYWKKQTADKPLFEDILWSRPENKLGAGKLLIIGGNLHGFSATTTAYAAAEKVRAGTIRVILPDALKRSVGPLGPYEFAPSTKSGSFGKDALTEFLVQASWADAVLLAGDLGRNSETAILLESFVQKYSGPLIITKDAVDYFNSIPEIITNRPQTVLVLSLAQLQKLATALKFPTPFLLSMGLLLLVQALHEFTQNFGITIVTKELNNIVVGSSGQVSSTKLNNEMGLWRVKTASTTSVFWMQNPEKIFESITTSIQTLAA